MADSSYDIVIVGAGIVGLATALHLLQSRPDTRLLIVEAEDRVGAHQTGHNSGVIHSGIYYRPGTLKARYCVEGARALLEFCEERNIPYNKCGKVIVATQPADLPRLEELERRGRANGVEGLEMVGTDRLREIEPHARGLKALYSPNTAIIDYRLVAKGYAERVTELGGEIRLSSPLKGIEKRASAAILRVGQEEVRARLVISCAGTSGDRIAAMTGCHLPYRILPFRGEYYTLRPERSEWINGLIYPVPDPAFPFLGIHLTRMMSGGVEAGPNAVLSLSRQGYRRGDFNLGDAWQTLTYRGFWSFASHYWKVGVMELARSYGKRLFLRDVRKLVPEIQEEDLLPGGAGVRAQVVTREGRLCDDFAIVRNSWSIHVLNAPSPAATAALRIGKKIADLAYEETLLHN